MSMMTNVLPRAAAQIVYHTKHTDFERIIKQSFKLLNLFTSDFNAVENFVVSTSICRPDKIKGRSVYQLAFTRMFPASHTLHPLLFPPQGRAGLPLCGSN